MTPPCAQRRKLLVALPATLLLPTRARSMAGGDAIAIDEPPVVEMVEVTGGRLEVQFAPGFDAALRARALTWVRRSAGAVAGYFGRFPVPEAELLVTPVAGAGVRGGTAYGEPTLLIRIRLGRATTEPNLLADWVLVHEMIHLAIPRVPRSQHWLHEGIATYVEGIARAQAGLLSAEQVWREWVRGMPQGLPQAGDRGLDHTPTWGRTYWGGALFCLLGDVRIRRQSELRFGLQHALRGVLSAGGHYGVAWPVMRILEAADAAVAQTTLVDLYASMRDRPSPVDLEGLWRELGVSGAAFQEGAPLAAIRRAILS